MSNKLKEIGTALDRGDLNGAKQILAQHLQDSHQVNSELTSLSREIAAFQTHLLRMNDSLGRSQQRAANIPVIKKNLDSELKSARYAWDNIFDLTRVLLKDVDKIR